jgi:hypothetical protein
MKNRVENLRTSLLKESRWEYGVKTWRN